MFASRTQKIAKAQQRLASTADKERFQALENIGMLVPPNALEDFPELCGQVNSLLNDAFVDVRIEALFLILKTARGDEFKLNSAHQILSHRTSDGQMVASAKIAEMGARAESLLPVMWGAYFRAGGFEKKEIEKAIRKVCSDEQKIAAAREVADSTRRTEQEAIVQRRAEQEARRRPMPADVVACRHAWFFPPAGTICTVCGTKNDVVRGCRTCGVGLCEQHVGVLI